MSRSKANSKRSPGSPAWGFVAWGARLPGSGPADYTAAVRIPRPVLVSILILGISIPWLGSAHRHTDAWAPSIHAADEIRYLPSGELLKIVALGYDSLLADVFWIRATLLFGQRYGQGDRSWYGWLYHMLDLATDLDPGFKAAYKYGGTMLRIDGVFVDQSSMIFAKGARALPDEWYFPFSIAMNYFLYKEKPEVAARHMLEAARKGTGPFFLSNLAASMLSESRELDAALTFLEEEVRTVRDERARRAVEVKVIEVRYLIGRRDAGEVIAEYRRRSGGEPDLPEDVAALGLALPPDPLGGRWVWDRDPAAVPGSVASTAFCDVFEPLSRETGLGRIGLSGCDKD